MKKRIAILGSTGSIGTQTLEVIRLHPEYFTVEVLSAQNNCDLLIRQAIAFKPNAVVIGNKNSYGKVKAALASDPVKVFAGEEAINQIVEMDSIDLVLNAQVGFSGFQPTLNAIRHGKNIALANKETLVVAGKMVMEQAALHHSWILPVDSEHSAIFQCLIGEQRSTLEKIYLTASGGPFLGYSRNQLKGVSREAALNHPNWKMGSKITIDSATMMNKGLEVIEARWLFNLKPEQIDVIIHPQSVIHSIIQFHDGSMKAQMGRPDMKLPILFALAYPERIRSTFPRFSFPDYPQMTFTAPDVSVFPCLLLAYSALEKGGNLACIVNAANESAVAAFLNNRIEFLQIPEVIERCMHTLPFIPEPSDEDYLRSHRETMIKAEEFIRKIEIN